MDSALQTRVKVYLEGEEGGSIRGQDRRRPLAQSANGCAQAAAGVTCSGTARSPITVAEIIKFFPVPPSMSSRERNWSAATVDLYPSKRGLELNFPPLDHNMVVYALRGYGLLYQKRGGREHQGVIQTGHIMIMPAHDGGFFRGDMVSSIVVCLPLDSFSKAAYEIGSGDSCGRLLHIYQTRDAII